MDILENKQYKTYTKLSRYATFPIFYNSLDDKYQGSLTGHLNNTTPAIVHIVKDFDTLDSLSLYYYGNPTYYWIIADYNRIQDPFTELEVGTSIYIPEFSAIAFDL